MSDSFNNISPVAAQRANAMLPGLQARLARGVRRRKARARVASACVIVVLAGGAILAATLTARRSPPVPAPAPMVEAAPAVPARPVIEIVRSMDAPSIEIVRDTPRDALLAIYASSTVDLASILVTDRELLDLLNEIGRPSGLVRANGKVWLTAAVTDEEIEKQRGG